MTNTKKNFVVTFNQNPDFEAAPKGFEAGSGTLFHCINIAVGNGFNLNSEGLKVEVEKGFTHNIEVDEDSIRLFNGEGDWALIEAE